MGFFTRLFPSSYLYQLHLGDIPVPVVPRNSISNLLGGGLLLLGLEGRRGTGDRDAPISNGHLFDNQATQLTSQACQRQSRMPAQCRTFQSQA